MKLNKAGRIPFVYAIIVFGAFFTIYFLGGYVFVNVFIEYWLLQDLTAFEIFLIKNFHVWIIMIALVGMAVTAILGSEQ